MMKFRFRQFARRFDVRSRGIIAFVRNTFLVEVTILSGLSRRDDGPITEISITLLAFSCQPLLVRITQTKLGSTVDASSLQPATKETEVDAFVVSHVGVPRHSEGTKPLHLRWGVHNW
jgi:hypothetical protein